MLAAAETVEGKGRSPVWIGSCGIYLFRKEALDQLLRDHPWAKDFGRELIPLAIKTLKVRVLTSGRAARWAGRASAGAHPAGAGAWRCCAWPRKADVARCGVGQRLLSHAQRAAPPPPPPPFPIIGGGGGAQVCAFNHSGYFVDVGGSISEFWDFNM